MRIREGAERCKHRLGSRGVICPAENLLPVVRNGLQQTNQKRNLMLFIKSLKETMTISGTDRKGRKIVLRCCHLPAVRRRPPATEPESGTAGTVPRQRWTPTSPGHRPAP